MATLIYSPAVAIVIESSVAGLVDVSADASVGSVVLRENGSHSVNFSLENPRRKYDGLFTPNDRIVVQMKRFNWLQIMSGYLDSAPYFSAYARKVNISAQCPLKVLKFWPWDQGSSAAQNMLFASRDTEAQDGGMSQIVTRLLTEVANWPSSRVHIGKVPSKWYSKAESIFNRIDAETKAANNPILGVNPTIAGTAGVTMPGAGGSTSAKDSYSLNKIDYDVVLATLRKVASGNDYSKVILDRSGAYQVPDSLWGNYGGHARASLAPATKQDEFATERLRQISATYGARLVNVPLAWFTTAADDPTQIDKPVVSGSTLPGAQTARTLAYSWVDQFMSMYQKMRGHAFAISATAAANIFYPIPPKTQSLTQEQMAWGGFKNGEIPQYPLGDKRNPMAYSGACRWGHPLVVEAFTAMYLEAQKYGFELSGGCYRDATTQRNFAVRDFLAKRGYSTTNAPSDLMAEARVHSQTIQLKSSHGWGMAVDIGVLSYGDSSKYRHADGWTRARMYTTPEYQWLKANAHRWGFGQVEGNMEGAPNGEAWHWDFFAIAGYNLRTNKRKDESVTGYNPFTDAAETNVGLGSLGSPTGTQLYSIISAWTMDPDEVSLESNMLYGHKALLNDKSLLDTIAPLIRATGRSYCSAPNGDFIAWWPDYWGEYGIAGALDIETIELQDFSVDWSDAPMITHQYVEGAYLPGVGSAMGPMPRGITDALQALYTRGVATVEIPGLLESLLNVPAAAGYPWLRDPRLLLQRFGARVDRKQSPMIYGAAAEFYAACANLTRAWADQFTTRVPLTFMPEIFPGMLLRIPYFGVQMYVSSVTHSWDYSNGAGFSTEASTMAVSATDGSGFFIFPKGGDRVSDTPATRPVRGFW